MRQGFAIERHHVDREGNPAGGITQGTGIDIRWQNGPLGREADRIVPNGAFVEDVIDAAIGRLEFYQRSVFACGQNGAALKHLRLAIEQLEYRTGERKARGVEGTHEV